MMDEPHAKVMVVSASSADLDEPDPASTRTRLPVMTHTASSFIEGKDDPAEHVVPSDDVEIDETEMPEPWPENEAEIAERQRMKLRAFRRAPSMDIRQWAPSAIAYWKQRCAITADIVAALRQAYEDARRTSESLLVDAEEAARLLGISVSALEKRVQRNQVPGVVRTGRRLQFHRERLIEIRNAPSRRRSRA